MIRPAQTVRSERTREALRQAALVRFLAQGVEETSAEQIAADAGVTLRTFYRHFSSKHDLLFADYTGLNWFRAALNDRPVGESIIDSVQAAIFAFPYDVDAVAKIAALRDRRDRPGPHRSAHPGRAGRLRRRHRRPSCTCAAVRPIRPRTSGCALPSPRAVSRRPYSARWRSGCSAMTARWASWPGSATSRWRRCGPASRETWSDQVSS